MFAIYASATKETTPKQSKEKETDMLVLSHRFSVR
jgi:hypothetical protein